MSVASPPSQSQDVHQAEVAAEGHVWVNDPTLFGVSVTQEALVTLRDKIIGAYWAIHTLHWPFESWPCLSLDTTAREMLSAC